MRTRALAATLLLAIAFIAGCSDKKDDLFFLPPQAPQAPPQAANDAFTALGNSPLNVTAAQGVLVNDPVPAPVTGFQNPTAQGGAAQVNLDGSFTYTPPTGFLGADTFTYTIANLRGQSQAVVTAVLNQLAWYVDNRGPNGDGSFNARFNNLAAALAAAGPGDVIFIFRGDGTSNGLAGPVALQDGQVLLGEGAGLTFNNGINPRQDAGGGEEVLAQQIVAAGGFPVLTGPVTLADGNTVSGLRLENAVGDAISGTGVNGVMVVGNQIANPTDDAIGLANATGALTLSNNVVTGTGDIGFDLTFDSVNSTLVVQNNQLTDTGDRGINLELFNTANVTTTLTGNTVTNSGPGGGGIELVANQTSIFNLAATGNTVNGTQDVGFGFFGGDASQTTARILNNTITGAAFEGLSLSSNGNSRLSAEVRGNTTTGNGLNFGFFSLAADTAEQCLAITGNTSDRFVFFQNVGTVIRVEDFANLQANNIAGVPFVQFGAVTDVAVGTCGF